MHQSIRGDGIRLWRLIDWINTTRVCVWYGNLKVFFSHLVSSLNYCISHSCILYQNCLRQQGMFNGNFVKWTKLQTRFLSIGRIGKKNTTITLYSFVYIHSTFDWIPISSGPKLAYIRCVCLQLRTGYVWLLYMLCT